MSSRKCKICSVEQPIDNFNVYRTYKGKPQHRRECRICYNQKRQKKGLTEDQKEKHRVRQQERRRNNPIELMLTNAKARAKRKGIEFSITESDITIPDYCPVLGIKLVRGGNFKGDSPSLDRIDNSKGYIPGNVCVISYRANGLKSDATIVEIENILRYMREEAIY